MIWSFAAHKYFSFADRGMDRGKGLPVVRPVMRAKKVRDMIRVEGLTRYPVKGLSPEPLEQVTLTAGDYFPCDRIFAVEDGPSGFAPDNPQHFPKIKFLMLMRHEALARLKTHYDAPSGVLTIENEGAKAAQGNLAHQ